jgi:hypothetical protein
MVRSDEVFYQYAEERPSVTVVKAPVASEPKP